MRYSVRFFLIVFISMILRQLSAQFPLQEEVSSKSTTDSYTAEQKIPENSSPPDLPDEVEKQALKQRLINKQKLEQWLQQESITAGKHLSDNPDLDVYLKQRAKSLGRNYISNLVRNETLGFLNSLGQAKLNFNLTDKMNLTDYSLDYRLPVFEKFKSQFFSQMGARTWQERDIINFGLGYRFFLPHYMLGLNIFYDRDLHLSHERISTGLEFAGIDWRLSANYYTPLSSWIATPHDFPNVNFFQTQPAEGIDFSVTGHLPFYPPISGSLDFFQWFGNKVDFHGGFLNSQSPPDMGILTSDPQGLTAALRWNPIPLITTTYSYTVLVDRSTDFAAEFALIWHFDKPYLSQMTTDYSNPYRGITEMRELFVKRQNNIILNYHFENAYRAVRLPTIINAKEGDSIDLQPEVKTTYLPVSYQWSGSLAAGLSNQTALRPSLTIPGWQNLSADQYTLVLEVTDLNQNIFRSNEMKVNIIAKNEFRPDLRLFSDAARLKPIAEIAMQSEESGRKIYWTLLSNRSEGELQLQNFAWKNNAVFTPSSTGDRFPEIRKDLLPEIYQPLLVANSVQEGNYEIIVPIHIRKNNEVKIEWDQYQAELGLVEIDFNSTNLNNRRFIAQARVVTSGSLLPVPSGEILYSIGAGERSDVAIVNTATGEVIAQLPGVTKIVATQIADDNYTESVISYILNVKASGRDSFYWQQADKIPHGEVTATYQPGLSCDFLAVSPNGSPVTYQVKTETPTGMVSINDPTKSVVTVNKPGESIIQAVRSTDNATLEYTLKVKKADANLHWSDASIEKNVRLYVDFSGTGQSVQQTALAAQGVTAKYKYVGLDASVATVNPSTGEVTLNKPGSLVVSAFNDEDDYFAHSAIDYTLIAADPATPSDSGLSWVGSRMINNVLYKTYEKDAEYVQDAVSHPAATGNISYFIATDAAQDVAEIVNMRSGLTRILKPGYTKIIANQEAGSGFAEQSITYQLSVQKNTNPTLRWQSNLVTKDNRLITSLQPGDRITVQAISNHAKAPVIYEVMPGSENIASVNAHSGEVTIKQEGAFHIQASQADNNYFSAADTSYAGYAGLITSQLAWNDQGRFNQPDIYNPSIDTPPFFINGVSLNCFGQWAYAQKDAANDVITLDSTAYQITLNKLGSASIIGTFTGSHGCTDGQINYDINVKKSQGVQLKWQPASLSNNIHYRFFDDAKSFIIAALPGDNPGKITYSVEAGQTVASIDPDSGRVSVLGTGKTRVSASQPDTAGFNGQYIEYDLVVNDYTLKFDIPENTTSNKYESAINKEVRVDLELVYDIPDNILTARLEERYARVNISTRNYISNKKYYWTYQGTNKGDETLLLTLSDTHTVTTPLSLYEVWEVNAEGSSMILKKINDKARPDMDTEYTKLFIGNTLAFNFVYNSDKTEKNGPHTVIYRWVTNISVQVKIDGAIGSIDHKEADKKGVAYTEWRQPDFSSWIHKYVDASFSCTNPDLQLTEYGYVRVYGALDAILNLTLNGTEHKIISVSTSTNTGLIKTYVLQFRCY